MLTELLAPAKDKETAISAIDCGADAVYIGASNFGARKNASNSLEDIKIVIDYAHKFWAKVFITMNTILTDSELEEAVKLVFELEKLGADALIVQDLGLLNRLMQEDCKIPIHMSTQCDNYSIEKVKFFNEIGVSRVVLARETSLEKIKQIHSQNPNLELEFFVHGALCVSMSGQCYLSHYIGNRSANRGECAQPCRKKYSVETIDGEIIKKDFYALCLKDFNTSNCLDELINAGIYSLKIEGRLKDVNYVKNIVAFYRQKLGKGISSGKSFYEFEPNPYKSFNRGFTEYFLKTRTNCFNLNSPKSQGEYLGEIIKKEKTFFEIKTDKQINIQDGLFFNDSGCAVNKVIKISDFVYRIFPNKSVKIELGEKIYRNLDTQFEKQLNKKTKRQIGVSIYIQPNSITLIDEDGVSVTLPLKQGEVAKNQDKLQETYLKQFSKTGDSDFYIENIEISGDLLFLQVSELNNYRRIAFEKLMEERLRIYNAKIKEIQKPLKYADYYLKEVDYRANVHNKSAIEFYEKCNVNIKEMSFESSKPSHQVALMHCKHCIKYSLNMCKSPKQLILKDEFGQKYPLKFDCKNCEMYVMQPLSL